MRNAQCLLLSLTGSERDFTLQRVGKLAILLLDRLAVTVLMMLMPRRSGCIHAD